MLYAINEHPIGCHAGLISLNSLPRSYFMDTGYLRVACINCYKGLDTCMYDIRVSSIILTTAKGK